MAHRVIEGYVKKVAFLRLNNPFPFGWVFLAGATRKLMKIYCVTFQSRLF